jgi:hypothetical protein
MNALLTPEHSYLDLRGLRVCNSDLPKSRLRIGLELDGSIMEEDSDVGWHGG